MEGTDLEEQERAAEKAKLELKLMNGQVRSAWLGPAAIFIPAVLGLVTVWAGWASREAEERATERQERIAHLERRLDELYVPVTMRFE